MYPNLAVTLDRADELLRELISEYEKSLRRQEVGPRECQLTHEVCERLRSALDRVARLYWDQRIAPSLPVDDAKRATVYFPICDDILAFNSTMGRWRWKSVQAQHQDIHDYLLSLQPFQDRKNHWLAVLHDMAVTGKHIDLLPQTRVASTRTTVHGRDGSVSWGPGVTFGGGVSIMGAPIDPRTQSIVPTPGVTQTREVWVSFVVAGHNVNAAGFCQQAASETRRIIEGLCATFTLS